MSDLVSQFEIEPYYTQINYHGKPVRVTPLIYGDLFKWFANSGNGVPAYLQVDMVTQETTLTRLDQGMKYAPGSICCAICLDTCVFAIPPKYSEIRPLK